MPDQSLQVLAVAGSLHRRSVTRAVVQHVAKRLKAEGCIVDVLDFETEPLPLYNPDTAYHAHGFDALQTRVERATVARQCYAWTLPYGVSFAEKEDVKRGQVVSGALKKRLDMFVHDVRVYGTLLARQRRTDLAGTEPGFMAKHRK